jgi:hypothetical protein
MSERTKGTARGPLLSARGPGALPFVERDEGPRVGAV